MNYAIEEYVFNDYNASSKARKDVSFFVQQIGFKTLVKNDKSQKRYSKIAKSIKALKVLAKVFSLNKDDVIFIQTSHLLLKPILRIKKIKSFKVIYLIHDIFSLRYNTEQSIEEHRKEIFRDMKILNCCDCVVAHNQLMIDRLRKLGCNIPLVSLNIFDYYSPFSIKKRTFDNRKIEIAFAGNISKSYFLNKLDENNLPLQINVYGAPEPHFKNLNYKGCVDADILPNSIEGHFGLIWEGNYESSLKNNYNEINNPHKLSMYIVSCLPIIALKGSAAGLFIEKEGIGIVIDSLDQLYQSTKSISKDQYQIMVDNCYRIREKLVKGFFINSALNECLNKLKL